MSESFKKENIHYNPDFIWPSVLLFIGSLIYYVVKYFNLRRGNNENVIFNANVNSISRNGMESINNNNNNDDSILNNNSSIDNINNNNNSNNIHEQDEPDNKYPSLEDINKVHKDSNVDKNDIKVEDDKFIYIYFQSTFNNKKSRFKVDKTQIIEDVLKNNIYKELDINENSHKIIIIYLGRKINSNLSFESIQGLSNNAVIHLFVTVKTNTNNYNNNNNEYLNRSQNNNDNNNLNSSSNISLELSRNSVHINTIKVHGFILIFFAFFVYQHKFNNNLLVGPPKIILSLLFGIWIIQFSNMIAKLSIYKRVLYADEY